MVDDAAAPAQAALFDDAPDDAPARALIAAGALVVLNHSGGKDSQAMYLHLRDIVPREQIAIVHADLGEVEWAGALDHIRATTDGEEIVVTRARRTLLQMVDERGKFPSPTNRQCTSDLKRGPIERAVRQLVAARRARGDRGAHLVVNCMGMRAQESSGRSRLQPFKRSETNSKAGREWFDWLPIHHWTAAQVFARIAQAGQQPHPVYALGMSRFSCAFCIMSSERDLRTAATLATTQPHLLNDPRLYQRIVALERKHGQVMMMPTKSGGRRTLEDITGVPAPR